jgi:zinc-binding alcohol dehydrogenase family protein
MQDTPFHRELRFDYLGVSRIRGSPAGKIALELRGAVKVHVTRTLPIENANEAHQLLEAHGVVGKLVLTIQWQELVHDLCHRPALQDLHLHGQDRPGQSGPAPAAVDDSWCRWIRRASICTY